MRDENATNVAHKPAATGTYISDMPSVLDENTASVACKPSVTDTSSVASFQPLVNALTGRWEVTRRFALHEG